MTFIEVLLRLIENKGIPNKKMITDLNLGKNAILTWRERGNIPSGDVLIKIADYFDVSTDYLLGRTDDPMPPKRKLES